MKKTTLLFLLTGGLCSALIAQPVLTATGIAPVVGDSYSTTGSSYVSPGGSGANQTWNLAFTNGGASTSTGVTPGSSPYAASFPQATVAFNGGGVWTFNKSTTTAWQNCGVVNGSGTVLSYSDFEDFLHFPFTYTNTYTDPWAVTYIQASYTYYRWGTTTVTADAYGTLTTPDGTFSNVTRVHFYQVYKDSTNIASTPFVVNYVNDQYMWYLNGNHSVIASVYTLTPDMSSPFTGGYYMNNVVSGVNDFSALTSLSVAPNPANEQANFTVSLSEGKEVSVALFNAIGEEVGVAVTTTGMIGENRITMPVADLPAGIYFAAVSLDGIQTSTQKFVVTH
jgi:hypothetical protein